MAVSAYFKSKQILSFGFERLWSTNKAKLQNNQSSIFMYSILTIAEYRVDYVVMSIHVAGAVLLYLLW